MQPIPGSADRPEDINDTTRRLLVEAAHASGRRGDELRQEVVRRNMPVAKALAQRYAGRGIATEDLCQVAYVALVCAVQRFDPDNGADFLSFAVPTIRGELRRHFRDQGWMVRPTRRIQELQARIWSAEATLYQRLRHSPTPSEIAGELGVEVEEVIEALATEGCFNPWSLDAPTSADGNESGSIAERLGAADPGFASAEARVVLAEALRTLSDRDRDIVRMRFFEGLTQQQIGDQVGVTQMQISRLLHRILRDLRRSITTEAA